ncbi:uncharacterized protein LOC116063007 [Sander lucioperca]|uniref:Uncharacterized LOC116063007 n=1 Tax=Sander lucioperca TaxID=283035 RepID=A0A8C9YZH6_SANLU|nr:uncharacterized protein LOC116063007 [Sander lucioperca]
MPMFCVVNGCTNRSDQQTQLGYHRVPKVVVNKGEECKKLTEMRRKKWLENLPPSAGTLHSRVCSDHFVGGCPSALNDVEAVDWVPTLNLHTQKDSSMDLSLTVADHAGTSSSAHPPDPKGSSVHTELEDPVLHEHDYCKTAGTKDVEDETIQCDEIGYVILQKDRDTLVNTGISLKVFNILVSTLKGHASTAFPMSVRDQVLMTLMKLKTNRVIDDLSKQFCISQSVASNIISYWIDKLEEVLRPLIPWLPRETIQATMPEAFQKTFPNTTCIIRCSECLLQKTQTLDSRGESYSLYYDRVKYLVAVAPCGLIMFISAAYGCRCSDRCITLDSGILDYLMPGDEVMVDEGSGIKDLPLEKEIKLIMPSFTAPECPTHTTADLRFNVERALRRLKLYKILSRVVSDTMALKINKILRICSALVNLREDVIREPH